jgi:hypothetical protein
MPDSFTDPTTVYIRDIDDYIAAAEKRAAEGGRPIPVDLITADQVLEMVAREVIDITPEQLEAMRPDAEKLAKGMCIKATNILSRNQ